MFLAVQTTSHKNQNYSGSYDPVPLKTGSLISSFIWAIVDRGAGRTYWGRLTCDRNTRARVTFRLRQALGDNRFALQSYRRVFERRVCKGVSLDSGSSGLTGVYSVFWPRV